MDKAEQTLLAQLDEAKQVVKALEAALAAYRANRVAPPDPVLITASEERSSARVRGLVRTVREILSNGKAYRPGEIRNRLIRQPGNTAVVGSVDMMKALLEQLVKDGIAERAGRGRYRIIEG